MSRFSIVLLLAVLAGGIVAASYFGPLYKRNWEFEDKLEETLGRLSALGNEGVLGDIAAYTEVRNMPIDPYSQCNIFGTPGKAGRIVCTYEVEIKFPLIKKPYVYRLSATGKRTQIPLSSY